MMPGTFRRYSTVIVVLAVISIVYGALVALGQSNIKRRIAYTSVNHMGYVVLGVAVAGAVAAGDQDARRLALTGATVEMIAHGLITGSLFLLAGSFWSRTEDYEMDDFGGLAAPASRLTAATTLAAFASLGLPGLAGFVAEVQIFIGAFAVHPVAAGLALLGVLLTAALFLQMLQRLFFGELPERWRGFADLDRRETATLVPLLLVVLVIGIWPRWLLDLIDSASRAVLATISGG
jgi:NADH-quinone oxidoreductase subunit M